jgi:hypothetical protein
MRYHYATRAGAADAGGAKPECTEPDAGRARLPFWGKRVSGGWRGA